MSWKNILKEETPKFPYIYDMLRWMQENNIKNARELGAPVMTIISDGDKSEDEKAKELQKFTTNITRDRGLRKQWIDLLKEKSVTGFARQYYNMR
jgi:hypothetical protein